MNLLKKLFERFIGPSPNDSIEPQQENPKKLPSSPSKTLKEQPHTILLALPGEETPQRYTISQFEEVTGVRYLPHLHFESPREFEMVKKQCRYGLERGSIAEENHWLGAYFKEEIDSSYINEISIRWINEELGFGVFAERDIKAWEYIGEYVGNVRPRFFLSPWGINDYCFSYPTSTLGLMTRFTIDAEKEGNEMRFVNHSDLPNSESVIVYQGEILHIIVQATSDISKGTQITYDYGKKYWRKRTKLSN